MASGTPTATGDLSPAANPRDFERRALESVLASDGFDRSKSLSKLLTYICNRYFEGQAHEIKEYSIAVEALGRPADFDQKKDAIVRVEMHRLRKRLREYYSGSGAEDPVQIVVPEKGYVPEFVRRVTPEWDSEETKGLTATPIQVVTPVRPVAAAEKATLRWTWIVRPPMMAGLAIVLLLLVGGTLLLIRSTRERSASADATAAPLLTPSEAERDAVQAPGDSGEIRILAGRGAGQYADRGGLVWGGDRFFKGGEAVSSRSDIINRGFDRNMFASLREGSFEYIIPVKKGIYEAELFFAETMYGDGNPLGGGETCRLFAVNVNGKPRLESFDILADAGMPNAAVSKIIKDIEPDVDGAIHLKFVPEQGRKALVNAIWVRPSIAGHINPIRIVARPQAYRDPMGRWWLPDRYYLGGNQIIRPTVPFSFSDAYVFQGERYGNFNYTIPVPPGKYGATLYFYEYWWGKGHAGGPGRRRFDVYCNYKPLLTDFDITADGGAEQAVKKTFHGLTPDAQGKLSFAFVSQVNYALVNAIEIVDESR